MCMCVHAWFMSFGPFPLKFFSNTFFYYHMRFIHSSIDGGFLNLGNYYKEYWVPNASLRY